MKNSRRAALRTLPYLFLAVALVVMAYPAIHAPAIHADDQALPTVGSMAPDFTLNSQEGTAISLHSFRGKWVVLYFYPKIRRLAARLKRTASNAIRQSMTRSTPSSWA